MSPSPTAAERGSRYSSTRPPAPKSTRSGHLADPSSQAAGGYGQRGDRDGREDEGEDHPGDLALQQQSLAVG